MVCLVPGKAASVYHYTEGILDLWVAAPAHTVLREFTSLILFGHKQGGLDF